MSIQIDYNDPRYAQAAAELLWRRDNCEPEANITSTAGDFLILTGRVRAYETVEENPPALIWLHCKRDRIAMGLTVSDLAFAVSKTEEFGRSTSPVEYRYKLTHRREPDVA